MEEIKIYIIKMVILSVLIQLIGSLIKKDSFKRIYNLVGGIMVVFTLLGIPIENAKLKMSDSYDNEFYNDNTNIIENEFTKIVSEKIKKDIKETFGFDGDVEVNSDLNKLKITIKGNIKECSQDINKYIRDKYCTDNDEVELINGVY